MSIHPDRLWQSMKAPYCEVALPLPLRSTFTYAVPNAFASEELVGRRVLVPFRNRAIVGVGLATPESTPEVDGLKEVAELLDPVPALSSELLELGRWVSRYYLAPIGETLRSMLPPEIEVNRKYEYCLTEVGRAYFRELVGRGARNQNEAAALNLLESIKSTEGSFSTPLANKIPGGEATAEKLVRRGCLQRQEVVLPRKTRLQKIVAWSPYASASSLTATDERVRGILTTERGPMPMEILLEKAAVSRAVVQRMERQNKVVTWEEPLTAEEDLWEVDFDPPANILNSEQKKALSEIAGWLRTGSFTVGLLHGVTGSGKTEVYLGAVEVALSLGRTALLLVPEIALTLWTGRVARARFGEGVAVLHSGLPEVERAREWWRVRRGGARIVVGTRSAVFAPLENLGLVIVDEEQESSYKQEETPRYHGRDTAIMRAKLEGAVALLGSATPSLESYHHARTGKYHLLELRTRVENRPLARVGILDLRAEFRKNHRDTPVSESLLSAISRRLEERTQAMVLINRRGYSWFLLCRSCGAAVQCRNCSISLTYHRRRDQLVCHYCGYARRTPKACPKCRSEYLYFVGEGAERVEEYLREQFPEARIARLDRDTVRTKRQYQHLLGSFARGELDLLVGTQMVAKGHDFEKVTLVGVVSADLALGRPDFRAAERAFQLLTQVAGRAGRGRLPGEVLVETFYPEHYAIQLAAQQDYVSFFEKESHFRRVMHYPPFTFLANVLVRDRRLENAVRWSRAMAGYLAPLEAKGLKVLGPAPAALSRLRREYRFQFLLKTAQRHLLTQALAGLLDFCATKEIPESAVMMDVDPTTLS